MRRAGVFILSLLFLLSCAPRKSVKKSGEEEKVTKKVEKEEPVIIFEEEKPKESEEAKKPQEVTIFPKEEKRPIYGYRVQIYAFESKERAEASATDARVRLNYPVYVEFVPPFYKVRVGDFMTREEAERVRDELKRLGYEDAFIVETLINPH